MESRVPYLQKHFHEDKEKEISYYTRYISVTLQCLFCLPQFEKKILTPSKLIQSEDKRLYPILYNLQETLRRFPETNDDEYENFKAHYTLIEEYLKKFKGYYQINHHFSQIDFRTPFNFLYPFLQILFSEFAHKENENNHTRNLLMNTEGSSLSELFNTVIEKKIKCNKCGEERINLQTMPVFVIDIDKIQESSKTKNQYDLKECVEKFLKEEILRNFCFKCGEETENKVTQKIIKLPDILIFSFHRVIWGDDKDVNFDFNFEQKYFINNNKEENVPFVLKGMVNSFGLPKDRDFDDTLTVHCKCQSIDRNGLHWYSFFGESEECEVKLEDMFSPNLLFYERAFANFHWEKNKKNYQLKYIDGENFSDLANRFFSTFKIDKYDFAKIGDKYVSTIDETKVNELGILEKNIIFENCVHFNWLNKEQHYIPTKENESFQDLLEKFYVKFNKKDREKILFSHDSKPGGIDKEYKGTVGNYDMIGKSIKVLYNE